MDISIQSAAASGAFNQQKPCRYGQMVYNVNDMYVGRSLDLYGEFSELEVDVFRQLIQSGQVVLDIGANVGAHTLFFARQVGLGGRVLAFEPQRYVFQALCANVALNSLLNVWCYQQALGPAAGEITAPAVDPRQVNNYGGVSMGSYMQGERVPLVTLDSHNLPRCDFIKLDVEGMEQDVLAGATDLLARQQPVLYVENDREAKSASLIRFIDQVGYDMYWHRPPLYNPNNFLRNGQNVFGNIVSLNMLCIPRSKPSNINGLPKVEVPPA